MDISYVSLGAVAAYNGVTAGDANMPAGYAIGDILVCITIFRTLAGSITSSWTTGITSTHTNNITDLVSYRVATSTSETAPTLTPSGGTSSQLHMSRVVALRGVNPVTPFGNDGGLVLNASQANIGPIPHATAAHANGAVFVYGGRLEPTWTAVATLSGDSLSWVELFEDKSSIGNGLAIVCDYALWTSGVPTLTDKTFTVTTGTQVGAGRMFVLNAAGQPFRKRWGGIPFAAGGRVGVW